MTDEIIMEDNNNHLTDNSSEKIRAILNKIIDGHTLPEETPKSMSFSIKDLIKNTNVLRGEADAILNRLSLNDVLNYEEETFDYLESEKDDVYVVYFDDNFLDKANKYLEKLGQPFEIEEDVEELDDEKINAKIELIEIFNLKNNINDYKIAINKDYSGTIKVSKIKRLWKAFYELVDVRGVSWEDGKYLFDTLNYREDIKIYSQTGYPKQQLIVIENNSYKPNFKCEILNEHALKIRRNKSKLDI